MHSFIMNGYIWQIAFVHPNSPMLVDRTGEMRVATTDPAHLRVYLSDNLTGEFLITVLIHELGHCALFSFNLIDDIHRVVEPRYWYDAEEWVCNLIANYGLEIFSIARDFLGEDAWELIPREFERIIA